MLAQDVTEIVLCKAAMRQFEHALPFVTKTYTTTKTQLVINWQID